MTPIRLSPSATLTATPAGVLLRSDLGTFQITGADLETFLAILAPLLDGSRDRAAVQAALSAYSPASVAAFLGVLAERGLVEEGTDLDPDGLRRGQIEFLRRFSGASSASGAPAEAMARLAATRVVLAGSEPWGEAAAVELRAAGIGAVEPLSGGALDAERCLLVAAVPPGDVAELERVARLAHRAGVRALWSHLDGGATVLGPLTVPGRTACRICAASDAVNPPLGARPASGPRAEIMARLLGHSVALEVLKLASAYTRSALGGRALVHDLTTFETRLHTLVRLPWCRVCGVGPGA